jgi:hypothetical protein
MTNRARITGLLLPLLFAASLPTAPARAAGPGRGGAPARAGAPARGGNESLAKPYPYTVGDAVAARAQGIFRTLAGLESPTLVYYDRDARAVVVEIVGGAEDVDGAKREIEAYVEAIRQNVAPVARRQFHVELRDLDVTLVYYGTNDEDTQIEVLRRENGAYITPRAAEGEGDSD